MKRKIIEYLNKLHDAKLMDYTDKGGDFELGFLQAIDEFSDFLEGLEDA